MVQRWRKAGRILRGTAAPRAPFYTQAARLPEHRALGVRPTSECAIAHRHGLSHATNHITPAGEGASRTQSQLRRGRDNTESNHSAGRA